MVLSLSPEPQYLPNVGPSKSTLACPTAVYKDYRDYTGNALDRPLRIDPYAPLQDRVFNGVQLVTLAPGTVTGPWRCTSENGCYDDAEDKTPRGTALLWIPDDVPLNAPRVLYLHGGSWWYGSPWTYSYPTFAARLAKKLGMPILTIDYTLAPVGNFTRIIRQVGRAVNYLARHEPLNLLARDMTTTNPASAAPPLFIMGDSSGAGTVISALVAQASRRGLPGAGQAVLSGAVVYSPWVNLLSSSPTYLSNAYGVHEAGNYPLGDLAFGFGGIEDYVQDSQENARDYMGGRSLKGPIANPFFAPSRWLKRLAPIVFHVGQPELLLSDSAILANRIAHSGGSVVVLWSFISTMECGMFSPCIRGVAPAGKL
jgi:acetyl esterase/lipase